MARILPTARTYKRHLLAHEAATASHLTSVYHTIWQGVLPHVQALQTALQAAIEAGQPIDARTVFEHAQATNLLDAMRHGGYRFAQMARAQVEASRTYAASLGGESAQAVLAASVPRGVSYTFGVPSHAAIAHLSGAIAPTSPLGKTFNGWGDDLSRQAKGTLLTDLARGIGPRQVARDLADAGGIPLQRALVIARDQMVDSYRQANLANYRANSDVVEQWIWVADLSPRTCALCLAMHGSVHDLSEDMDSHVCCRCTAVPKTRSWADILGDAGIDASDISGTSVDIPTDAGQAYFDGLSASDQDRVLGASKGAAYRAGDIGSLSDLVAPTHDRTWGNGLRERSMSDLGLDPSAY